MAIKKVTAKNPYGDDKGFAAPSSRVRKLPPTTAQKSRTAKKAVQVKHYLTLVVDEHNNWFIDTSPSLSAYRDQIISTDTAERFLEACERVQAGRNLELPLSKGGHNCAVTKATSKKSKKRRKEFQESPENIDEEYNPDAYRRSDQMLSICVSDHDAVRKYYSTCLRAFQQINCRALCKAWIKVIQPKKQVKNPYNGSIKGEKEKDPDRTKPEWWDPNVRHKEPDHLKKDERIRLMVHIMDSSVPDRISFEQLFEEVLKKRWDMDGKTKADKQYRMKAIHDMIELGRMRQRWLDCEIDGSSLCEVENHEEYAKKSDDEEVQQEGAFDASTLMMTAPPVLTPITSAVTTRGASQPPFGITELEAHQSTPSYPASCDPYTPETQASFQTTTNHSRYHDMTVVEQQNLAYTQQEGYPPTTLVDQTVQRFNALTDFYGLAPWTAQMGHIEPCQTPEVHPYSAEHSHLPHGLPSLPVGHDYGSRGYHGHVQVAIPSPLPNSFPPIDQMDPRHNNLWRC